MIPSEGTSLSLTLGRAFLKSAARGAVLSGISIVFVVQSQGSTLRPYTADAETLHFIEHNALSGQGVGYADAHLLAAVRLAPGTTLWTSDRRLPADR